MRTKIIIFILLNLLLQEAYRANAQTPTEVKYKIWDMHALRYYPFKADADTIIYKVIDNLPAQTDEGCKTKLTRIDAVTNQEFLNGQRVYSKMQHNWLEKIFFNPYRHWFDKMEPVAEGKQAIALSLLASGENEEAGGSAYNGIFDFPGNYTVTQVAGDALGDMNLARKKNDVALAILSGPLSKEAAGQYHYYLSDESTVDFIPCYEIAFFSKKPKDRATEGILFIDKEKFLPVKAVFTVNFSLSQNYVKNVLMTHYFDNGTVTKKENRLLLGDDMTGSLLVSQELYYDYARPTPEAPPVVQTADSTGAWRNVNTLASFLLTGNIGLGRKPKVELGPVLQTVSYNKIEGLRLRLGLNTTTYLNNHITAGGYLAYGTKDEELKYRADIRYSPKGRHNSLYEFPASLFSFTYAEDLNIPGQDLLTSVRDNLFQSFYHSSVHNMAWQKIARLSYLHEFRNRFSFELSGKYLSDESRGTVQYQPFSVTEAGLSLRYAPNEKTFQVRNERRPLRSGDLEIKLSHRIGIELFGSDYSYHITTLSVRKRFHLPSEVGRVSLALSGGKVWDQVPFPLLFIPPGNHSYVISDEDYNLMSFYEFTTDQYAAANLAMQFNWSPASLFLPRLGIRTDIGFKALYGPMSDKNDPLLHPSLPMLNNGVKALGDKPYMEASIGFSNILRVFRIEYVRRLSYLGGDGISKGSLFIGAGFTL